jgi:hypothetical protein
VRVKTNAAFAATIDPAAAAKPKSKQQLQVEVEISAQKKKLIEEARAVFADPNASREAVAAAVAAMNAA